MFSFKLGDVRFRSYSGNDGLKGFVDFQLVLATADGEEGLLELKDWTIREVEYEGKRSMRLMPPGKPAKEGSARKYDNYAFTQGKAWWKLADQIVGVSLNGGGSTTRAPAREEAPAPAPAPARTTTGRGFMGGRGGPGRGLA